MREIVSTIYQIIKNRARIFKKVLLFTIVILLLENILLAYNNLQASTPILGLKINNQNVSLKNKDALAEYFNNLPASLKPIQLTYNSQSFQITPEDIGSTINPQKETDRVLKIGRSGNLLTNLKDQNLAILGLKNTLATGDISESKLALRIFDIQTQVDLAALPQMPDFKGDTANTLPARDGLKVDTSKLIQLITQNGFTSQSATFNLPIHKEFPINHSSEDIDHVRGQAQDLINQPITITSGGLAFTLTQKDLKNMLTVAERPDTKNPARINLTLRLDDVALNRKLGDFAQKVEALTHSEFDDHDARVAIYAQFYSGKRQALAIPTGRRLPPPVLGTKDQNPEEKIAYLTFDDGPNSIYHPLILDILKKYNIQATFFLVGKNGQKDPDIAKRTKDEGHVIGNHSLTHSFLPNLQSAAILSELQNTNDILKTFNNGETIGLFRPPYGGVNAYVRNNAQTLGLKLFLWDVDPRDWSEPPADELVRRVVTATHNGSDILLHSNHMATVQALPKIIETLQSQGYVFKTLN